METFSVYHYCFCFIYDQIRRYGPPLHAAFSKWPTAKLIAPLALCYFITTQWTAKIRQRDQQHLCYVNDDRNNGISILLALASISTTNRKVSSFPLKTASCFEVSQHNNCKSGKQGTFAFQLHENIFREIYKRRHG